MSLVQSIVIAQPNCVWHIQNSFKSSCQILFYYCKFTINTISWHLVFQADLDQSHYSHLVSDAGKLIHSTGPQPYCCTAIETETLTLDGVRFTHAIANRYLAICQTKHTKNTLCWLLCEFCSPVQDNSVFQSTYRLSVILYAFANYAFFLMKAFIDVDSGRRCY